MHSTLKIMTKANRVNMSNILRKNKLVYKPYILYRVKPYGVIPNKIEINNSVTIDDLIDYCNKYWVNTVYK